MSVSSIPVNPPLLPIGQSDVGRVVALLPYPWETNPRRSHLQRQVEFTREILAEKETSLNNLQQLASSVPPVEFLVNDPRFLFRYRVIDPP